MDKILQPLLSSMGYSLQIRPLKGLPQQGLDLYAIKEYEGYTEHYLITIKKGDLNRTEWNKTNNGGRDSLNELIEVNERLIRNSAGKNDKFFIVLCLGGELLDDVRHQWLNYKADKTTDDRSFKLWDGDELSKNFDEHLLNESILLPEFVPSMRRALVNLHDIDYDLGHFRKVLLNVTDRLETSTNSSEKLRLLSSINMFIHLVHVWAKKEDNLKPALRVAELSVIETWRGIKKAGINEDKSVYQKYEKVFGSYLTISSEYITKCYPNYFVEYGVVKSCSNSFTSSLVCLEELGILAVHGIIQAINVEGIQDEERKKRVVSNVHSIKDAIEAVIKNNTSSTSIYFDGHYIEVMLVIFFFNLVGEKQAIDFFVQNILTKLHHSIFRKMDYPISSDSPDEFLDRKFGKSEFDFDDLFDSSTLIPCLLHYSAWSRNEEAFNFIQKHIIPHCPKTTFQYWFLLNEDLDLMFDPDNYQQGSGFVANTTGTMEENVNDVARYYQEKENNKLLFNWGAFDYSICLISSRSIRKPLIAPFWAYGVNDFMQEKISQGKPNG